MFFLCWAFLYSPLAAWYAVEDRVKLVADEKAVDGKVEVVAGDIVNGGVTRDGFVSGFPLMCGKCDIGCFSGVVIVPFYSANQFNCCKCKGYGFE